MSFNNIGSKDAASGNLIASAFNGIQDKLNDMLMDKKNLADNVGKIHEAQVSLAAVKRTQGALGELARDIKQG
jgi:hypothetical protein